MLTTKKYLCFAMILALFCAVSYGGCGGSSSSDGLNGGSEDVYVPETENPENVTPTPVPVPDISPDVQPAPVPDTSPDVQPAPDTPNSSGGESVSSSLNGTWRVESGTHTMTLNGVGTNVMPYIQGSASPSTFAIAVSRNTNNDYYSIDVNGDKGVDLKFSTGSWAQYMNTTELGMNLASMTFYTYENNTYTLDVQGEFSQYSDLTSWAYSIAVVDNSTAIFRMSSNQDGVAQSQEVTIKRVN